MEIVLVKRNPWAMVLPDVLNLAHTWKTVPVVAHTKISFELNGEQTVWAKKWRKRWAWKRSNVEPDGPSLLNGRRLYVIAKACR